MKRLIEARKYIDALEIYDSYLINKTADNKFKMNDPCDVLAIKSCINCNNYHRGKEIHSNININMHNDGFLHSTLINFYGLNNDINNALNIFQNIRNQDRDIVIITSMIKAYVDNNYNHEALQLYNLINSELIKKNDKPMFHVLALKACSNLKDHASGILIQSNINNLGLMNNIHIRTQLIHFYGECGDIRNALMVFGSHDDNRDKILINSMMSAYNKNSMYVDSLLLYNKYEYLLNKQEASLLITMKSCINIPDYEQGKLIAKLIENLLDNKYIRNSIKLKTILICFYGHIGDINHCISIYNSIDNSLRDNFVIDTMMESYYANNYNNECLNLFRNCNDNIQSDLLINSYVTALKACTVKTNYYFGKIIHDKIIKQDLGHDVNIQCALINMYGKCGMINVCENIFTSIDDKKQIEHYNAMINSYGRNGKLQKSIYIYKQIESGSGLMDKQTYIAIINACSHCGDMSFGKLIWNNIVDDEIKYDEHVMTVLIDGISRCGLLEESYDLIVQYHSGCKIMWISLLSACRKYKNIDIGYNVYNEIRNRFISDNKLITTASILLANIYGSISDFENKRKIMNELDKKGLKKWNHGISEINIYGKLHTFYAGYKYKNKNEYKCIDEKLYEIINKLKLCGYKPDLSVITRELRDSFNETCEDIVFRHSEKLAVIYGLINTRNDYQIIINKNLRICDDCHNFMKILSKMEKRILIISDVNRVHTFKNGHCSCGDYY